MVVRSFVLSFSLFISAIVPSSLEADSPGRDFDAFYEKIPNARLIGHADIRALGFRLYKASLYSQDTNSFEWTYPFALHLEYDRAFSQALLVGATMHELDRLEGTQDDHGEIKSALQNCFHAVTAQDAYTALAQENGRLQFYLNGRQTCEIVLPNISQRILGIWLSNDARSPALRSQLLGKRTRS